MDIEELYPVIFQIGWILTHFVWQGAIAAIILWILLKILNRQSANSRYIASCLVFFSMLLMPFVTLLESLPANPTSIQAREKPTELLAITDKIPLPSNENSVNNAHKENQPTSQIDSTTTRKSDAYHIVWYDLLSRIDPFLPGFVLFWIAGIFILSTWRLAGWIGLQKLKRIQVLPIDGELETRFRRTIRKLRIREKVRILESAIAEIPLTIGYVKPVIILPTSVFTGLSPAQIEAIVAHELAHIRRHDYLVNVFQILVETVFFYHPAVWWISNRIRLERERCCDEIASRMCGNTLL